MQKWAALLAGCTGSVNEVKAVRSAVLRSAAGKAATPMAARKAATAPRTRTNTRESACRWVPCHLSNFSILITLTHDIMCLNNANIKASKLKKGFLSHVILICVF